MSNKPMNILSGLLVAGAVGVTTVNITNTEPANHVITPEPVEVLPAANLNILHAVASQTVRLCPAVAPGLRAAIYERDRGNADEAEKKYEKTIKEGVKQCAR
jgi:hypothetical protein